MCKGFASRPQELSLLDRRLLMSHPTCHSEIGLLVGYHGEPKVNLFS